MKNHNETNAPKLSAISCALLVAKSMDQEIRHAGLVVIAKQCKNSKQLIEVQNEVKEIVNDFDRDLTNKTIVERWCQFGDFDSALELTKIIGKPQLVTGALCIIARAAADDGQFELAIETTDRIDEGNCPRKPYRFETLIYIAEQAVKVNQFELTDKLISKFNSFLHHQQVELLLVVAKAAYSSEDETKFVSYMQKAADLLSTGKKNNVYLQKTAEAYLEVGMWKEALDIIKQIETPYELVKALVRLQDLNSPAIAALLTDTFDKYKQEI